MVRLAPLVIPPRLHREGIAPYSLRIWECWKRQGLGNLLTPVQAQAVIDMNPSTLRDGDALSAGSLADAAVISLATLARIAAQRAVHQVGAQRAPLVGVHS